MSITWHPSNTLTLLENGAEFFPALAAAMDQAQTEIFLETCIFANDETGHCIAAALRRAAARDVTVRLMVDGFGGREFVATLMDDLVDGSQRTAAARLREVLALCERQRDLLLLGAYQRGTDRETDQALELQPKIEAFLRQSRSEKSDPKETRRQLLQLLGEG